MSSTFGIAGLFGGLKAAGRKDALSDALAAASDKALPFLSGAAGDLKKWGQEDWDKFKQTYRPAAEALVADANQAPEYGRYERESTLTTARGVTDANADVRRAGINPGSGRFSASQTDIASLSGRSAGVGGAVARQRADQASVHKKMNVLSLGKADPGASIAGLGVVSKGGADYGKYSAAIGGLATNSLGGAAQGFGKAVGGYRSGKTYNSPDRDGSGSPDYAWGNRSDADYFNSQDNEFGGDSRYAAGGVIRGPGTGRSDSIPAVIDGHAPARVSNGEYRIPNHVVAAVGRERLEGLIEISRSARGV